MILINTNLLYCEENVTKTMYRIYANNQTLKFEGDARVAFSWKWNVALIDDGSQLTQDAYFYHYIVWCSCDDIR